MGKKNKPTFEYKTFSGMVAAIANCDNCGWRLEAKNAIGAGANHTKHFGHLVRVEIISTVSFRPSV